MPMLFKKGDSVRQVVKPIEGEVVGPAIVDGEVQYEVKYTGEDMEEHSRFFRETDIEKTDEAGE
jgi:hypothetical protein